MCIKGNCGESSHTSWNGTEKCSEYYLASPGLLETFEYHPLRFDVQGFDHHHHYDDKACDKYGVPENISQKMCHIIQSNLR